MDNEERRQILRVGNKIGKTGLASDWLRAMYPTPPSRADLAPCPLVIRLALGVPPCP